MDKLIFKVNLLTLLQIVSFLLAVSTPTRTVAERVEGEVSLPKRSLVDILNPKASCETECCDYCCNWYCPSTDYTTEIPTETTPWWYTTEPQTDFPYPCPTSEPCECEIPTTTEPSSSEPCICPTDPPVICTEPTPLPCECYTDPPMTTCPPTTCEPCPTCPPPEPCPSTQTTPPLCTTIVPPTCPPIPTCPTEPTPPPPTDNPVFSKIIYQSSIPSWPIAGTTVHLGLNATTEDYAPIRYELLTSFEFLTLSAANDIIFISNVSDGAYVGPNNVMVIEVLATVIGDESRTGRAVILIVFPRSVTDETFEQ